MRVVQVINHFGLDRGGAERLARMLHEDLQTAGVDARIIALEACDPGTLASARSLGFASARDPRIPARLSRALRDQIDADTVVHAHLFPSTLYVSALRQTGRLRTPIAMTEHSTWNRRRGSTFGRMLDRTIYRGFDRIAAISDDTRDALLGDHPAVAGRVSTIRNGALLRFAAPPLRDTRPEEPCILTVARLVPVKNIETALGALARLRDRPWRYVIAGDGPLRADLEARAAALGIADRVRFLGVVEDITTVLKGADLFLLPSLWEGFGLAAVEAMNAGVPVIASDVAGLRELVGPAGNPVIDPMDEAGLSDAIVGLLDNPEQRAAIGARGFARAADFDKSGMVDAYRALWQDMTGGDA